LAEVEGGWEGLLGWLLHHGIGIPALHYEICITG
jgi:hypothetical protein